MTYSIFEKISLVVVAVFGIACLWMAVIHFRKAVKEVQRDINSHR